MRVCQLSPLVLSHFSFHLSFDYVTVSLLVLGLLETCEFSCLTAYSVWSRGSWLGEPWFPLRIVLLLSHVFVWRWCFRFLFCCFCFSRHTNPLMMQSHSSSNCAGRVNISQCCFCGRAFLVGVWCFGLFGFWFVCFCFGCFFLLFPVSWWPHRTGYSVLHCTVFLVHLLTKMAELHTALINVLHATACRSTWWKPRGDGREKYLAFFSVHRLVAFARSINKLLHEMN